MGHDASEVRNALGKELYLAPVGTDMPDDLGELAAPWVNVGYIDDAFSINPEVSYEDIRAAQRLGPIKRVKTEQGFTLSGKLLQTNPESLKLAFGGGEFVTTGEVTVYTPPGETEFYERAVVFEASEGGIITRYLVPRAMATISGEVSFARTDAGYDVEVVALESGDGDLWSAITNDPGLVVPVVP